MEISQMEYVQRFNEFLVVYSRLMILNWQCHMNMKSEYSPFMPATTFMKAATNEE